MHTYCKVLPLYLYNGTCQGEGYNWQQVNRQFLNFMCWKQEKWASGKRCEWLRRGPIVMARCLGSSISKMESLVKNWMLSSRCCLLHMGLRSCRLVRVPIMVPVHHWTCLQWVCECQNWSFEQWKKVTWSDKLHFVLDQVDGWVCMRCSTGQKDELWEEGRQAGCHSCGCYFDMLPWPPNCPDLNLTDHLWDELDQQIQ